MAQNIFTSQTPGVPNDNQPGGISLGTVFFSAVDGTIAQIRWFFPTSLPTAQVQGALYQEGTATQLATGTFSATPTAGAWNTCNLNATVNITAGVNYVVVVWSDGPYVATSGLFNGSSITNGDLTAPADDPGLHNGRFDTGGALQFPTSSFNGNGYFVDVFFEPENAGAVEPDGISIPVTLGAPTLAQDFTIAPDGISVPVTLGEPAVDFMDTVVPDGITIPVTLGEPAVSWSGAVEPDGITIPVTLGNPTVAEAIPPSPLGIDLALVVANFVKTCLCDAVNLLTASPEHCRFQVGLESFAGIDLITDECCEGVAYVAMGDMYPSWSSFPDADIVRQSQQQCNIPSWAVDFKLGIVRCAPRGTDTRGPTDAEWNAAALLNIADAQALRRATCCIRTGISTITGYETQFDDMSVVIGRQTTPTPQGGCMERNVTLTVQFMNCEPC